MSLTVAISIPRDTATPRLRRIVAATGDKTALNRAAAEGALPVVQRHFRALASSNRNRFGARSSFWNRMLSGTLAGGDGTHGWVRMPREIAQRRFGGTITPKKAKALAIPVDAAAYGKSPRQFNDLTLIPATRGDGRTVGVLVRNVSQKFSVTKTGKVRKGKQVGGEIMYVLLRKVTQRADSTVLPTDAELRAGALRGIETHLRRAMR